MQEEIENRVVHLAISTTRLTARAVISGFRRFDESRRRHAAQKAGGREATGKQTIRQLISQNQGVTSIDIARTDLRGFEKYARSYGVDYAITKDRTGGIPKYLCFFKARDADAMTAAFNAYSAEVFQKGKRPSVLKRLERMKAYVKSLPHKNRSRDKERSLDR
ncbi:MAG: PcfB family protein [Lachnospiraceae bacterium]|nr:PcfB family protein [Lachnospiraceae bacterium]